MVSINLIIKQARQAPEESPPPTHFQACFPPSSPEIKDHDGLLLQLETHHDINHVLSAPN